MTATGTWPAGKFFFQFEERKMKRLSITPSLLSLSLALLISAAVSPASLEASSEDRDLVVDKALGDLEMGSRILGPGSYEGGGINPQVPGSSKLSPSMDTGAARKVSGGNSVSTGPGLVGSSSTGRNVAPSETTGATGNVPAAEESPAPSGNDHGITANEETSPSEKPVEENPEPVNTEQNETVPTDHPVEEPAPEDVTTGETTVGTGDGSTEETQSPPAADHEDALVNVDAGVNTDAESPSNTVEADLNINPESEDIHIGADVAGGTPIGVEENGGIVDVNTEIETSTDNAITNDTIAEKTMTEIPPAPQIDLGAEIDSSGETVSGEVETGVEGDIDGSGAGDDVSTDPADGLSASPVPTI